MRKILIVEDDADASEILREILTLKGYEVTLVGNGEAALEKMRGYLPDLIITDIMMPKINGWDFTRNIRRNPQTATIPILMMTAVSPEIMIEESMQSGATEFLPKPFDYRDFLALVQKMLP